MPLLKSEHTNNANALMDWIRAGAKEQEEEYGFLFPEPLMNELREHPEDFTFKREGWIMIVEWTGHETIYIPIMEGKKSRDERQHRDIERN